MAAVETFARDTGHNPEAFWESTAKPLFDRVMAGHGISFDNIGMDDLVGDNSIRMMSEFTTRCKRNPPVSTHTKRPFSTDSLKKCLLAVIRKIKEKFGNQVDQNAPEMFPENSIAQWKKQLQDDYNRNMMQGEDESEVLKNVFPIPREHCDRTKLFPGHDFPDPLRQQESRRTDMKSIARFLFGRNRYSDLAKVLLTYNGIGRGGEVKFLDYRSMMFDECFNMLFAQWFQRKNLKSNPSGFVPDFEYPECCCFFALGCFWAVDEGLARPGGIGEPNTPRSRRSRFVFQDLHDIQDNSVTNQIGAIIKSCVHVMVRDFYSSKALRIGAMSHLTWDPAVTYEEGVALGGWATPSNRDYYVWIYLVSIIPAILSLAGYPDPRVLPYLPHCGKLFYGGTVENRFTPDSFSSFVSHLFPNSLPEFRPPHGRLRNLMVCVTAVMIMNFNHCYTTYGNGNHYVKAMINATINAELAASVTGAVGKLQFWSGIVKKDFDAGNAKGGPSDVLRRRTVQDQMAKLNETAASVLAAKNAMEAQLQENHRELVKLQNELGTVHTMCHRVMEQNDELLRLNATIVQQLTSRTPIHPAPNTETNAIVPPPAPARQQPLPSPARQQQPNLRQPPRIAAAAVPPSVNTVLQPRVVSPEDKDKRQGQRNKMETVHAVLRLMYNQPNNQLMKGLGTGAVYLENHSTWVHQAVFGGRDKAKLKITRVLMLIDALWTPAERSLCINHRLDPLEAISLFEKISKRVVDAAHVLKKNQKTPRPNVRAGAQLLGLANNIGTFDLERYRPQWDVEGAPIPAGITLADHVEIVRQHIRNNI